MSYQRLGSTDDVESLGKGVQSFENEVGLFARVCSKVGGPLETPEVRVEIDRRRQEILKKYTQLGKQVQACKPTSDKQLKLEGIKKKLMDTYSKFDKENSRVLEREKKTIHDVEERNSVGTKFSLEERQSLAFHNIAELNEDELRRRQQEINLIEKEMISANALFKDLGQIVLTQGDMLNQAAANVEVANDETSKAVANLEKAKWYQGKAKSKLCWILIIVIIVVVVIALIALGVSGAL